MSKFKIGDKVTPKQLDGQYHPWITLGGVYTVINTLNYGLIDITEDFKRSQHRPNFWNKGWSEDWFKLYEEKETEMDLTSTMNAEQIRDEILRIDARIEEAKKDIENAEKERNSLIGKLREKGFEIVKPPSYQGRFQVGDKVKVVDNTTSHWFPIGSEVEVQSVHDNYYDCVDSEGGKWCCYDRDVEKI